MKKANKKTNKLITILLALILLLVGCTQPTKEGLAQDNPSNKEKLNEETGKTQEPQEKPEYYLPELQEEFNAIDELTEEEAAEQISLLKDPASLGLYGAVLYIMDTEPISYREGLKAIKMGERYGLDFVLPNPYTGQLFGELYAHDVEYFEPMEGSIEAELLKRPYEERKNLPYRNYYDFASNNKEIEILSLYLEAIDVALMYLQINEGVEGAVFYTIPELVGITSLGYTHAKGVVVAKWPEDIDDDLKEILGDIVGDGNYYKHHANLVYYVEDGTPHIEYFLISTEDEYMVNLGPDWEPPTKAPAFYRWLIDKRKGSQ